MGETVTVELYGPDVIARAVKDVLTAKANMEATVDAAVDAAEATGEAAVAAAEAAGSQALQAAADARTAADDAAALTGAHTVDYAGGLTEGQAVYGAPISNAASRWYSEVGSDGALLVENVHTAIVWLGFRTKGAVRPGRRIDFSGEFVAANFSAQAGIGVALDDSTTTGSAATMGTGTVVIGTRAGVMVVENGFGAALSGYTVTRVGAVNAPAPAAGNVFGFSFTRNFDDTATVTVQQGAVLATYTIAPCPPGRYLTPVMRLGGGSGQAHPGGANPSAKIRPASWSDATFNTYEVTQEVTQQTTIGSALAPAVPDYGSPIRFDTPDANVLLPRALPPGMQPLPIMPALVVGPGQVIPNRTAFEAFCSLWPLTLTSDIAFVSPNGGAPGTAALNDRSKPFSLEYALRSTPARLIVALAGDYDPIDFRSTHTYGNLPKAVVAERRGACRMRVAGDDLTQLNYTATAGHSGVFQATWTMNAGGVGIQRLARRDQFDGHGFPRRLLRCTSLAALDAVDQGYFADTATKTLYIKAGGADVQTIRQWLKGYWLDASANARIYLQGAELLLDGFVVEGLTFAGNNTGATRPSLWLHQVEQIFASDYGIYDFGGAGEAWVTAHRWRCHGAASDGINLGASAGVAGRSRGLLVGAHISACGDFDGLGQNGTANKQAISDHGGDLACFGSLLEDNFGQQVADTSLDPAANLSWYVGTLARKANSLSDSSTGFGFYGATGDGVSALDRKAWLDTCATAGLTASLRLEDGASAKLFNCPTLAASALSPSVAPAAYTPDAP